MPLDTSLNSAYLSSRFGEDSLPRMVRSPRLADRKDGFDEELVQPELNIKLPYDVGALQSLVMSWFGAPGTIQVRDGGVAGTTNGTGTGIGTSGRAGGPSVYSYLTAANQDIFGERPLGHPYVATATTSLPNSATLWPPSPSAINLTDPASAHGGPSGMNAESTWYTPTQLATQITSALSQEFIVKTANSLLPNALVLVAGEGIAAPVVDTPGEVHIDIDVPGSDTQILYNNAGALGASANLVWNQSNYGLEIRNTGVAVFDNAGYVLFDSTNTYQNRILASNITAAGVDLEFPTAGGTIAVAQGGTGDFQIKDAGGGLTAGDFHWDGTQNISNESDIAIDDDTKGIILKDNAGTPHYWRVTVNTSGTLVTTDLGTSLP